MIPTYEEVVDGHKADALMAKRVGGLYIAFLSTPQPIRNRGCARRLLTKICHDADAGQYDLWLDLAPMDRNTDYDKLEEFYRSFGFVQLRGEWHRRFRKNYEHSSPTDQSKTLCLGLA